MTGVRAHLLGSESHFDWAFSQISAHRLGVIYNVTIVLLELAVFEFVLSFLRLFLTIENCGKVETLCSLFETE